MDSLILTGSNLTLEDVYEVAYGGRPVEVAPDAYARLDKGRRIMQELAHGGKAIYGFNRGVGWNKDQNIDEDFFETQNRMILRSHSLGVPPYNTDVEVRAMMVIRLNNMLIGASCASDSLANIYRDFLNHGITPRIPKRGAVGEADITTISHMGLAFVGEGDVSYKGEILKARQAMEQEGIAPCCMQLKDAHTIILSNCQGEAMAAIMACEVEKLLKVSDLIYCLDYEGLNGNIESLREDVNALRGLPGQIECAARCRGYLEGSYLYEPHPDRALQDPLSFRGGFTITGSVTDALNFVKKILHIQINSPSDNPCIMLDQESLYVTSNFETTSLAVGVEMLSIALGHLSRTLNYRMIKMCSPEFTKLTRFLAPRDGSAHGYDEIQNTYSSIDAENRSLVNPSSVDFYHMQGGIEDHASNLPLVASKGLQLVDNLKYLVGMEALYAAQAVDLRDNIRLGKYTRIAYDTIRETIPELVDNRNVFEDIRLAYELICSEELLRRIQDA
ncbi:MAG: aromatic amino acid lyase [Oscillibacter sp.]|nr:aromatic amino acid lyase [Oscillibacter sp.]MEA4994809.1 aromatic amino acid lyase [Oscillibacter sp.]